MYIVTKCTMDSHVHLKEVGRVLPSMISPVMWNKGIGHLHSSLGDLAPKYLLLTTP